MVSALSEDEAIQKAKALCNEKLNYTIHTGEKITWSLHKVDRAFLIDDIQDGAEIFSRYIRQDEAISLLTPFED